nr:D-aminoacyl-tRNA deacylase 1 isoform X1 [Kogia breviceps]
MCFMALFGFPFCFLSLLSLFPFVSFPVGGEQISAIGRGICVLLGISLEDTQKELEHMVRKILNLRVFEDESGKHWSKSVMDKQYEVLCISQFTLQCVLKGNKPDLHLAMPSEQAEGFYNGFLEQLRKAYRPELVKDGKFGAYMQVHIQNDGPVTIELESPAPGAATSDPKQARATKAKINKLDYIKLKIFCIVKEAISKMKRPPTEKEKIFANDISDKGLIFQIIYRNHTAQYQQNKQSD